MSLVKKENSFLIERTDRLSESSDIYSVYNIKNLSLSNEEKNVLFYTVKKMILSTNLYSKWKSSTIKGLLIVIHFCLFSSGICAVMINKELVNGDVQLKFFLAKMFLINLVIIPFWIFSHFYVFKDSEIIQNVMYNLGRFILTTDSLTNKFFTYSLNKDNLSIKVTRKDPNATFISKIDNYINYVINVNFDFDMDKLLFKNIIPSEDVSVLFDIDSFMKKELKFRFDTFIHDCLVPSFLIGGMYIFFGKEKNYFFTLGIVLACLICFLIFLIQKRLKNEFKIKFEKYIDSINEELVSKGKYIYIYKNLIMLFTLNAKGRDLSRDKLVKYINTIILK